MKNFWAFSILICMIGLHGCASTDSATNDGTNGNEEVTSDSSGYRELADYLRRVPGVRVTGSGDNIRVSIRGTSSLTSETRPLYVVDGQIRGNSYYEVSRSIDMSEVENVRVLTGSEAAAYGVRGANGIIEIELKR